MLPEVPGFPQSGLLPTHSSVSLHLFRCQLKCYFSYHPAPTGQVTTVNSWNTIYLCVPSIDTSSNFQFIYVVICLVLVLSVAHELHEVQGSVSVWCRIVASTTDVKSTWIKEH